MPNFFVPNPPPGETEEAYYYALAAFARAAVPAIPDRVYSITYTHNGEQWTSTVGETSRGIRRKTVGRGSSRREQVTALSDRAIVLAIFPGNPYLVVTNNGIPDPVPTDWANPFLMGEQFISQTVRFTAVD
jgi:hypothetical protein